MFAVMNANMLAFRLFYVVFYYAKLGSVALKCILHLLLACEIPVASVERREFVGGISGGFSHTGT